MLTNLGLPHLGREHEATNTLPRAELHCRRCGGAGAVVFATSSKFSVHELREGVHPRSLRSFPK